MRCLAILGLSALFWPGLARAAHPDLYVDKAGIEALRAKAADTQKRGTYSFAELYAAYVKQGDDALAKRFVYEVAVPDADGSGSANYRYELSNAIPPPHSNNPGYPAWTLLTSRLFAQMELLSLLYAVSGDKRWLRDAEGGGAVDIALAVSNWSSWNDPVYPCGPAPACLDTAHLTLGVSGVYDLGYDALTEAERTKIRGAIIQKGLGPLNEAAVTSGQPHNINALRSTALAVGAAAVTGESGAMPQMQKAHAALTYFMAQQPNDGGAIEGNLYGAYAANTIARAGLALERKAPALSSLLKHKWLAGLPRFAGAFLGTDNTNVNFGDASIARYWSTVMFTLAARGDEQAQWYLDKVFGGRPTAFFELMLARSENKPVPPPASPGGALYPETGWASLRNGWDGAPVLSIKSGPATESVGHNHFDHNSFVISAFGEWLAYDPGYRNYFNPALRNYSTQTIGHNSLLVDGEVSTNGATVSGGQTKLAGGRLRNHWEGAAYSRVIGEAEDTYPTGLLQRFTRRVYYARPDIFFVFDDIAAPAAHEYSLLLHTPIKAKSEIIAAAALALPGHRSAGVRGQLQSFAVASVPWKGGGPTVQSFPTVEAAPYAQWRTTSAREVTATTAIVPVAHAEGGATAVEEVRAYALGSPPAGIAVETSRGIDVGVSFIGDAREPARTPLTPTGGALGRLETDANLVTFGLEKNGGLRRAFVQEGTYLRVAGKELVRAAKAGGFDLTIEKNAQCVRLVVMQTAPLVSAPFDVVADVHDVIVDGKAVGFTKNGEVLHFPSESPPPPECVPIAPGADGGLPDGAPGSPTVPGDNSATDDNSGCACATAVGGRAGAPWIGVLLAGAALMGLVGRRRDWD
jgi:hypothetical protein